MRLKGGNGLAALVAGLLLWGCGGDGGDDPADQAAPELPEAVADVHDGPQEDLYTKRRTRRHRPTRSTR